MQKPLIYIAVQHEIFYIKQMTNMPTKKPKYLFVLGEEYEAEQVPLFNKFIWGNGEGYSIDKEIATWNADISIAIFILKVKDIKNIIDSEKAAPNHSAILPLEV